MMGLSERYGLDSPTCLSERLQRGISFRRATPQKATTSIPLKAWRTILLCQLIVRIGKGIGVFPSTFHANTDIG